MYTLTYLDRANPVASDSGMLLSCCFCIQGGIEKNRKGKNNQNSNVNGDNNNNNGDGATTTTAAAANEGRQEYRIVFTNPSQELFQKRDRKKKSKVFDSTIPYGMSSTISKRNSISSSMMSKKRVIIRDLELLTKLPVEYCSIIQRVERKMRRASSHNVLSQLVTNQKNENEILTPYIAVLKARYMLIFNIPKKVKSGKYNHQQQQQQINLNSILPTSLIDVSSCNANEVDQTSFQLDCLDGTSMQIRVENENIKRKWMDILLQDSDISTHRGNISSTTLMRSNRIRSLDDFEPIASLARGHFGKVFLVRHRSTNIPMAMKEIPMRDEKPYRQYDERSVLARLESSPFFSRLYYSFRDNGNLYYLMELGAGGDLWALIKKYKEISLDAIRFVAAEMVIAVEAMHTRGIAHRDIKLENVLFDHRGHVKLVDFGLSKVLNTKSTEFAKEVRVENYSNNPIYCIRKEEERVFTSMNQNIFERTHSLCGTDYYMPPEMLLGKGHSLTIDWWQLGCLVHELASGAPTFFSRSSKKIRAKIVEGVLSVQEGKIITKEFKDFVLSLLAHDPENRLGAKGSYQIKQHVFFSSLKNIITESGPGSQSQVGGTETTGISDDNINANDIKQDTSTTSVGSKYTNTIYNSLDPLWEVVESRRLPPPKEVLSFLGYDIHEKYDRTSSYSGDKLISRLKTVFPDANLLTDFAFGGDSSSDDDAGARGRFSGKHNYSNFSITHQSSTTQVMEIGKGTAALLQENSTLEAQKEQIEKAVAENPEQVKVKPKENKLGWFDKLCCKKKETYLDTPSDPYVGFDYICKTSLLQESLDNYSDIEFWDMKSRSVRIFMPNPRTILSSSPPRKSILKKPTEDSIVQT